jgi:hypothetical protein
LRYTRLFLLMQLPVGHCLFRNFSEQLPTSALLCNCRIAATDSRIPVHPLGADDPPSSRFSSILLRPCNRTFVIWCNLIV